MDIQKIGTGMPLTAMTVTPDKNVAPANTAVPADAAAPAVQIAAPGAAPAVPAPAAKKKASREQVDHALEDINRVMQANARGVEFAVSENMRQVLVKVVDLQTNKVITQIPSEDAIQISKELDRLQGLLVRDKA